MARKQPRKPPLALRSIRAAMRALSRISPYWAARLAFRLWHYPRRHPEPRREKEWLNSAQQQQVDYLDGQLTLYRWGEGPPVLLVHGWDGRASQMGAFAGPLVNAGYQAVAVDLPAHGRSSGKRTNMLESAAAVHHVGKVVGSLAAVIAHSFGAGASAKAIADGLRTDKVVLLSPPANLRWLVDNYHQILNLSAAGAVQFEKILVERYGESVWQQVSTDHNMAQAALDGVIVHDRDDRDVPISQSETLHRAWPQSRLVETTGLGHRRILRDPSVISRCVEYVSAQSDQSA